MGGIGEQIFFNCVFQVERERAAIATGDLFSILVITVYGRLKSSAFHVLVFDSAMHGIYASMFCKHNALDWIRRASVVGEMDAWIQPSEGWLYAIVEHNRYLKSFSGAIFAKPEAYIPCITS